MPCMERAVTDEASTLPEASAALMTSCCAGPLGAVSELERPSWLMALPRRARAPPEFWQVSQALTVARTVVMQISPRT